MSPRSSRWQGIAAAAIALAMVVLLAEVALHVVAPVPSPYEEIERLKPQINQYIRFEYPAHYSARTIAEPGLPGLSGTHHFSTNNFGFRGDTLIDPKPPREFRIFLVGGSTTECFYVDDEDEIGRVVQRELQAAMPADRVVRVYNTGTSGAASDDHVATISQRLVHFEPDLIVVQSGINDLTRSIYDHNYRHYIPYRPPYRKPWYKRWLMKLQIPRRLALMRRRVHPDPGRLQEERTLRSNYAGLVGLQRSVPATDQVPRTDEASYAINLRTMAGIARAQGFPIVFMTQQTTWNSTVDPEAKQFHWMRHRRNVTYREDRMDAAMERLNDAMRAVCTEDSIPLYDLARSLPKSLQYFYDDCHFNPAGAAEAGRGLAAFLVAHRLIPDARIGANTEMPTE